MGGGATGGGVPPSQISVCEIRADFRTRLKASSYAVLAADFPNWKPRRKFSRVVMNCPFKNDIAHVMHAYSMLTPNGVLVAVTSSGCQSKKTRPCADFRRWFSELKSAGQARVLKVPSHSFCASGSEAEATILILNRPVAIVPSGHRCT